jgi:hypothetical protein
MFNPNPAMPWFTPSAASSQSELARPGDPALSSGRSRFHATKGGPVTLPSDWPEEDAQAWVASYDQYIGTLTQAWQASSGLQRRQIEAQIADAKEGRKNALEIARMQDQTSRYGIDVGSQDRMKALLENQRQFNATHALDLQRFGLDEKKLGLDRAQTATEYLSTPDRFVQASDFMDLSGRVLAGQPGAGTGSGIAPQAKTMADFDALTGGGNPGRQVGTPQAGAAPTTATGGAGADARVKALRGIIEAAPPSDEPGLDNNAYHVLNAAKEIYAMNLTPGQQAALKADDQSFKMLGSAGKRLGYSPESWWERQQRSLPGQTSVRAA